MGRIDNGKSLTRHSLRGLHQIEDDDDDHFGPVDDAASDHGGEADG